MAIRPMNTLQPRSERTRKSHGVGLVAFALTAAGLGVLPAANATDAPAASHHHRALAQVDAPVPTLVWRRCQGSSLLCTTAIVPLDYDHPNGATIDLALVKCPADDQATKIGSLFVNPGGPGGPSTQLVGPFARLLGPAVRANFDVIGIDPRGIGRSSPLVCETTVPPPRFPRITVPLNFKQALPLLRFNAWERTSCATGGNAILDHMTTADTARDMDLIRQAVGDRRLSYYGISYGSYLGSTYAALFPHRIRAMIVDGVLDPIAWSTGRPGFGTKLPFSTRLRSGVGAWDALTSAFNECDRVGRNRCLLSGQATQKWLRIVHTLKQGPVTVEGARIRYSSVIEAALGALYSRSSYRYLMHSIDRLYKAMFVAHGNAGKRDLAIVFRRLAKRAPGPYGATRPDTSLAANAARVTRVFPTFEGVACADSVNPKRPIRWLAAGQKADAQGPWFGRAWTWISSPCAQWPGSSDDAFRGPWKRISTSSPLLIVGNFHDPATPISGARVVNRLFVGSRMFSLRTWGHGALGQSRCVTNRFSKYLVDGTLPPNGLVCQPDRQLFPVRR